MLATIGNYFEPIVTECLRETLERRGDPFDADYFDDLACVALNYLPARYVRHAVDLTARLTDAERRAIGEEVADAVNFAFATIAGRRKERDPD